MDLSDKGSDCEDASSGHRVAILRTCVDCGTSKTPLWRGGPAGPKSLCNACGIRSRKKRRALMGISKDEKIGKKSTAKNAPQQSDSGNSCTSSCGGSTFKIQGSSEKKHWAFGKNVLSHRPRSNRRKISREEEQAAFLLMALSCGSVYG